MKITDATVYDPRDDGYWSDPRFEVTVDAEVEEIGPPIFDYKKSNQYRLIPCGPFFAPEYRPDTALTYYDLDTEEGGDYGVLNKLGLVTPQLFPVTVFQPSGDSLELAMDISRVQRLMRKHCKPEPGGGYSLIVDEHAARRGLLKWRLEQERPVCYGGATPGADRCVRVVTTTVMEKGTHIPVCAHHLHLYESRMRKYRTQPRTGATHD